MSVDTISYGRFGGESSTWLHIPKDFSLHLQAYMKKKVKQSRYKPGVAQRVAGR